MMFKFHKTGSSGTTTADYLEDDKDHKGRARAGVEVLRGDPKLVGMIADSLDVPSTGIHIRGHRLGAGG